MAAHTEKRAGITEPLRATAAHRGGASSADPASPIRPSRWLLPYVIAVDAAAVALAIATASDLPSHVWPALLLFIAFAALAESWRVPLANHGEVSLCFVANFAAATLFGPCFGALAAGGASLIVDALLSRRHPAKIAFNAGQFALLGGLTGLTFDFFAVHSSEGLAANALAYAASALAFVVANTALTSVVFALHGQRFLQVWAQVMRKAGLFYLAMAPLGALVANAYLQSPWTLLYFPLLIWVIYRGFRLYARLQTETGNALAALANSLEQRDAYTFQHSLRVARYVEEIAASLGVPPEDKDLIVSAARVHDLGKISIDNRILLKEGVLTDEERLQIETHAAAGAELAGQFSMYRGGAAIIRHHHERWDGSGYPDGLAGESIPLGARIIAVADVYDAMTSDRPYRAALSHEVAVSELTRGSGIQFDETVVEAFLALDLQPMQASASRSTLPAYF